MCIFAMWKAVKLLFCTSGESLTPTSGTSSKKYCSFELYESLPIISDSSEVLKKQGY